VNEAEAMKVFVSGLNRLSRRTGIAVGACGCLGSPWLSDERGAVKATELEWDKSAGKYRFKGSEK
jgi:hypothetical protein